MAIRQGSQHPSVRLAETMKVLLIVLLAFSGSVRGFQTQCASCLRASSSTSRPWIADLDQRNLQEPFDPSFNKLIDLKRRSQSFLLASSTTTSTNGGTRRSIIKRQTVETALSAAAFVVMDLIFQRVFDAARISFPHSLAGCAALFASLLVLPSKTADDVYKSLTPGATLLAQWLPVLFVPSLITLPLAMTGHAGSSQELLKLGVVVVGGFVVTLLTTAYSVVAVRQLGKQQRRGRNAAGDSYSLDALVRDADSSGRGMLQDAKEAIQESIESGVDAVSTAANDLTSRDIDTSKIHSPKAFSDNLFHNLAALTAATGVAAVVTTLMGLSSRTVTRPLTSLFLLFTTLSSFCYGARLPTRTTKIIHPLVTCTAITWSVAAAFASITRQSFYKMLKLYRTGSLSPLQTAGAGDFLLFLLGPAVVSLAISMYSRRQLMRDNVREVGTAVGVSTFGGMFGTALAVRWLDIASPYLRLSLLSRNITSPLAMAIAGILGADVSFAVSIVVVTGLIGANFGASLLDMCGLKDPVARGLGIGAAAHGLGTAAFSKEKDAFPFAAIGMALTASAATVTVSIPFLRKMILQLALG